MQIIPFDATLIGTARLFPPAIEQLDWIAYHATSSYHSTDIDGGGFQQKKPLPAADLERLVNIATGHGQDPSDVAQFLQLKSLSFTPTSELALYYGRPESLGGQGLLHVSRLIDTLFTRRLAELRADETEHLTRITGLIGRIRAAPPVIYAVNLTGLEPMYFGKVTLAYHVSTAVPADRLVAKMTIDKPVDYSTIDVKAHNQALRNVLYSPHPHCIKQIAG